jgi:uncharacterized protein YbgA (DUF1722 family)/uncharacterized protein YbbK (DUF523 family)
MSYSSKPVVVVSKCIGFECCRYNGQYIHSDFVNTLKPYVNYMSICPEMEIGLGVPRGTLRLVSAKDQIELFQPSTGKDYTEEMLNFSEDFFSSLQEIDGFILKSRSPSCGIKDVKIYLGKEKVSGTIKGSGIFGKAVSGRFPHLPVEDEGRLTNFRVREHFLTKLFTMFSFRQVKYSNSISQLAKFQSYNKYLLMAYHQREQKALGKIAANHENMPFNKVVEEYEKHLAMAFAMPPRYTTLINSMMHILGYFSDELTHEEKAFMLDTFEKYKDKKVPLSVPLHILKSYAIKYKQTYLLDQTIWNPYPAELVDISDSGKMENS